MQLSRLGALVGFSLQICAGGAALIWPNDKWIGWTIFTLGSATLIISLFWWSLANYRPRVPWLKRGTITEKTSPQMAAQVEIGRPTLVQHPPKLESGLYVGEIRLTLSEIEKDRHSEITIRVFNGTGRVVEFSNLSGQIKFNAPNNTDVSRMGNLPPPALRADSARTVVQLQEWFLILTQRVPATEADKLVSMIKDDVPIHFDFSGLKIEVFSKDAPNDVVKLPLWHGVSYSKGYGFGRIIGAIMNAKEGTDVRLGR